MKLKLSLFVLLLNIMAIYSQDIDAPVIDGDTLLCPETDGTAMVTNDETYDTYQWYFKYWFTEDEFEAIDGANEESFTYDWYTYDQALLKLMVTKDGETYESNEIQIDSYAFASLFIIHEPSENVETDPSNGNFLICDGDSIENSVQLPYTTAQWYKDGEPIEGANETTYTITETGTYYVEASPEACPNMVETSIPFTVAENSGCESSTVDAPVIDGDTLLCPETDGTAMMTNDETYDTYQWYFKYWFTEDEFEAIDGANEASFTYDWYTYDQALLKLMVTKDGETYESNEIQIDSYAFAGLLIENNPSENVEIDPANGNFFICEGDYIENTVQEPYTIVQWFKDGEPIEGATEITYTITEPGTYTVEASPEICPTVVESTPPIVAVENPDCAMGVNPQAKESAQIQLKRNPVKNYVEIDTPQHTAIIKAVIYTLSGQEIHLHNTDLKTINVSSLAKGIYILKVETTTTMKYIKFIKE